MYYPLDNNLAKTAHDANSMSEFRSDEAEYRESVDRAYQLAQEAAERDPSRADEAMAIADRYAQRLAAWYNKYYAIECMCPSILISGGANFPTKKKQRQNEARDRHYKLLSKIQSSLEKLERMGTERETIKSNDQAATDKLRAKLEKLQSLQEEMKAVNKLLRKKDTAGADAELQKMGYSESAIKELRAGDFLGRIGYPDYALSNNNAKIRATKKRLEALEAQKEKGTTEGTAEIMGEACEVVENAELMRLQLIFDGKPSEEVRTALKRNGFRWSPKNGAWQRQLTPNARHALRYLVA